MINPPHPPQKAPRGRRIPLTARFAIISAAALALIGSVLVGITNPASADKSDTALQPSGTSRTLSFVSAVSSKGTTLNTLPGGITYGWNHLEGKTRWGKRSAKVEFLGDVDYKNGSGPFNGYVTVTRSDGTKIAFTVVGWSSTPPGSGTGDARFRGTLAVIGGSKNFRNVKGTGTMTGTRSAALGGTVNLRFALAIEK